ncbi:hypothetical protein D0865_04108 [Hortaea werneckii]|uniref:Prokaryotic-type class I peptide chain release factors domain-containing protein n=1 Tax=Hortaea werneckii TaxID=91943 RepID=A0A3M7CU93_HORWE|nr:hypothetical protein D0865_04108 [Hortaea werneckii]
MSTSADTVVGPSKPDSISPALLTRARTIAQEHATLTDKLASDYDAASAKRLGELQRTSTAIKEYDKALSASQELQSLLASKDQELRELAEEDITPTEQQIAQATQALKHSLIPIHPFAHLPCLIEIRPGAGGDEAALFAGDLVRMYEAYCARNGLRASLLKYETADGMTAGVGAGGSHVQEAILEVDSPGAYGVLRCEAGVHRVQRVPATESKGRTHTSAASVLVLPSIPAEGGAGGVDLQGEESFNDPKSDYYVDPRDVKTDVMRASGAGGQHVNRTESAVRLTHFPTNSVVMVQETRSQTQNREKAWRILRARIAQMRREEREEEMIRLRRGAGAGRVGRENKVRTYNWGQQRVSDHRSGLDSRHLDDVMEGGDALEGVMESVRAWMSEQEVLGLVAEEEQKAAIPHDYLRSRPGKKDPQPLAPHGNKMRRLEILSTVLAFSIATSAFNAPAPFPPPGELATFATSVPNITPGPPGPVTPEGLETLTIAGQQTPCPGPPQDLQRRETTSSSYQHTLFCLSWDALGSGELASGSGEVSMTVLLRANGEGEMGGVADGDVQGTTSEGIGSEVSTTSTSSSSSESHTPSQNTPTTTSPVSTINTTALEHCFHPPPQSSASPNCAPFLTHISTCHDTLAPWTDPYDSAQSVALQA